MLRQMIKCELLNFRLGAGFRQVKKNKVLIKMKKTILAVFATSLMYAGSAIAADMKIGYVDINSSMENTKTYIQGIKRVEALQNKKKQELEAMRKKVTDMEKELQMQSVATTSEYQVVKQQEFARLKKEFEREVQDATDELKNEKRILDRKMLSKFYDAVRAYGKENKFDMIIPTSIIIYGTPEYDLTSAITMLLDKK